MNKIETIEDLTEVEIDALFKERALDALERMEIPRFVDDGLVLARSEKEIAKCVKLAEKAEHKKELRRHDAERKEARPQKRKETGWKKAQKTNAAKKIKGGAHKKHGKPFSKKEGDKKLK